MKACEKVQAGTGTVHLNLLGFAHYFYLFFLFHHGKLFGFGPLISDLVAQNQEVVDGLCYKLYLIKEFPVLQGKFK